MDSSNIRPDLHFRHTFYADQGAASAYAALVREVFDVALDWSGERNPVWTPFGFFDGAGTCVAGVEAAVLATLQDGAESGVTAIRLAGVAEAFRGRGLFRDLISRALAWCEDRPTLLYTKDHALYTRFGFQPLDQHAFVGSAPPPAQSGTAELIDNARLDQILDRLLPNRAPLSRACAIVRAPDLVRASVRGDDDLSLAYAPDLDALIVYEIEDETLVLADVVAASVPTLAQILGALEPRPTRVRTLFPPDQLDWNGAPERDETGLMIRGPVPPAMRRPFMLPPTTAF